MSNSIKDAHVNGKPKDISVVGNETLKAVQPSEKRQEASLYLKTISEGSSAEEISVVPDAIKNGSCTVTNDGVLSLLGLLTLQLDTMHKHTNMNTEARDSSIRARNKLAIFSTFFGALKKNRVPCATCVENALSGTR